VDTPFDHKDWIFEIKWDGYRAVAYCNDDSVELISRNNKPFTGRYQPVTEALEALQLNAVFDGEVVAVNDKGLADFQMLQNWQNAPVTLQYFIFDIIWLDGMDLTRLPLLDRKAILKQIIPAEHGVLKYSDHVQGEGKSFYDAALAQGLEGIMAKKAGSTYEIGSRTESWLKVKVNKRQEVIIAGFTQPRNTRKFFGALLLGVYHNDQLIYIGHTGSGFNKKSLEEIYNKLQPLVTGKCPFIKCPKGNMPVTWVKPKLVCEIKFTEWTKELIARHPIFMGLRTDKKPKDVTIENSTAMASVLKNSAAKGSPAKNEKKAATKTAAAGAPVKKAAKTKTAAKKTAQKKSPQVAAEPVFSGENDQMVSITGHELKLTNGNKLYWKKEGFSKGDMIRYYREIAPFILPYLLDRPQSLNRHPNGIDSPNFFQKDMEGKLPDWMPTHTDFSESTGKNVQYLVCRDEATLVYMANMGCIEINPWHSRTASPLQPDWCLIDLDPDTGNTYDEVVETAQVIRKILDGIGAKSYPKTSGSTGLHIYIPLGARYSYDQSKQLAELVVNLVNQELPENTSVERNPQKRKGKIYLDFLQNRETQTAAAPYSLRPKPGVPVSAPLHWDEVKKGLTSRTFTAFNIFERLKAEGDLFKPVLQKGIDLEKVLKKMQALVR
jgi:bifunctional non-homologous end joining protein LigD